MKEQIILANANQVVLYKQELVGQISDGYWENSSPRDHWRSPCRASVVVGEEPGVNFIPHRAYNFNAKNLVDVVGERMMQSVRVAMKFPKLSPVAREVFENGEWWWKQTCSNQAMLDHHVEMVAELKTVGITNFQEMKTAVDNLDETSYTMKDMRKDLRGINAAFKNSTYSF